jgi:hypothetical protein
MSYTEFHSGRLIPVNLEGTTLKEKCIEIAKMHNVEFDPENESWKSNFVEDFDEYRVKRYPTRPELFIFEDKLYVISNHHETQDEEHFMKLSVNGDGSIDFIGQFYNGGTCFSEMLEESLIELKKENGN